MTDSEVNPPENRVPSARYTSTLMTSAIPLTGITPNGCSANVRISGDVVPESLISAPSIAGAAANTSVAMPPMENRICLSRGLNVADSAAPDRVAIVPEPIQLGTNFSPALPLIVAVPNGCSANVRTSGSVVPDTERRANPDSAIVALTVPRPVKSNRVNRSSGLAVLDSAAPDSTDRAPEPLKFGMNLSPALPLNLRRFLLSSATATASTAPDSANREPEPRCAADVLSAAVPTKSNRPKRSSGLAVIASAAPDRVEINPVPV